MSSKSLKYIALLSLCAIAAITDYYFWCTEMKKNSADEGNLKKVIQRQLTNEEKLEIAAQVLRGEHPESDLKKYGISIGERRPLNPTEKEAFLKAKDH